MSLPALSEQRGNRDLDFTFDQFSHMDVSWP